MKSGSKVRDRQEGWKEVWRKWGENDESKREED